MNDSHGKKSEEKFNIQFNRTDPAHIQAAELLNRKGRRGKAQYIANAILYYESRGGSDTAPLDERYIEAAINRILNNRRECGSGILPGATSPAPPLEPVSKQPPRAENIVLNDEAVDFDADEIDAIANALEMFKMK